MLPAQNNFKTLDQAGFEQLVLNQWWSYENKEDKFCDMRLLVIKPEGFELNCINWTDGFSGSRCPYTLQLRNNVFELSLQIKDCPGKTMVLYGYIAGNDNLFLLVKEKQMPVNAELLAEKDWLRFEKIIR